MRCVIFALCFSFILTSASAQDVSFVDSLKYALSKSEEDTNRIKLYADLSWVYALSYPDSALAYCISGLQLAKKLNFQDGEFNMLSNLGLALSLKGNYSKALETELKAQRIAEKSDDQQKTELNLHLIGCVYFYSGNYQKALYYFQKVNSAKVLSEESKFTLGLIGETYFHLNNLDSALFYIKKVYDFDVRSSSHWSVPYTYMAAIYDKKGYPLLALDYYREGNKVAIYRVDAINGYMGMASAFKKIGREDSAIYYSKKVIAEGLHSSFISAVLEASKLLTDIYKAKHFTDSAFKYQELALAAKDSLFSQEKVKQLENLSFNEQLRQQEIETEREQFQNKIKIYSLIAALGVFLLIAFILFRNNEHKQKANALLYQKNQEMQKTLLELKSTHTQLIQSEKMASLGELTAGIAHEIQNPLNFVNNFSEVSVEMLDEQKAQISDGNKDEAIEIADEVKENLLKVVHHGQRADAIVKGMLQHSRASTGKKEPTDINALADEYLRLSYHGFRAKDKSFNATIETHFDKSIGKIEVIPQDIGRVLLNLFNNAFYAVTEKKRQQKESYEPAVVVSTKKGDKVIIVVRDNGVGIPQKVVDKIFHPFFTTKPTGQGTGLGLSLSYDIIKAHAGEIKVETKEGEGAVFIILLPLQYN